MKAMRYFEGQAEKAPDGTPDKERFTTLSAEIAKDAAPYLHARLSNVTMQQQPPDLSNLTNEQLDELERLLAIADNSAPRVGGETQTQH
jgi:hypothetical protein